MKTTTKKYKDLPGYLSDEITDKGNAYLEQIRVKEYSSKIPKVEGERKVVILWSGGMDSTASLLMALRSGVEFVTLSFKYGQEYDEKEVLARKRIIKELEDSGNDKKWEGHYELEFKGFVSKMQALFEGEWGHIFPMRNFLFLSEAKELAKEIEYNEVWFSAIRGEVPFSGGDKSSVFLRDMQYRFSSEHHLLLTPVIGLDKTDLLNLLGSKHEKTIMYETLTCFSGEGEYHCSSCRACFNRAIAFYKAGVVDNSGMNIEKMKSSQEIEEIKKGYLERIDQGFYLGGRKEDLLKFINYLNA